MKLKIEKSILLIAIAGLLVRIGFILIGAKFYFGRPDIYVDADTQAWQDCIATLINTGTYSTNHFSEYGYFIRMPGYSFFIGLFYLLCGENWDTAIPIIAWFQTLLDFFMIVLIYQIGTKIFLNKNIALILSALYAC